MDLMVSLPEPTTAPTVVRLPANGTTATAEDLRNELVFAAMQGRGTEIDAGDVQSVGQAVLQLLAAARRESLGNAQAFLFRNPAPEFAARVAGCALAREIGLDAEKDNL